jgi:micrococcal nuclease
MLGSMRWLLVLLLLTGCAVAPVLSPPVASTADPGLPVPPDAVAAPVVRDVDGDTVIVTLAGRRTSVRLVGIDTPESVKPDTPVACYGHQASALTTRLVTGVTLRAAYEVEHQDKYGRALLDLWLPDGRWLQGVLVASGVARAYPFKPNTLHAQLLWDLEKQAHDARRGLWGSCGLYDAFPQLKP